MPEFLHFFNIGIWPLIMGVTMYLQQKLNPAPTDPVQARVFQFLPIMFTFMMAPFSAGLVIYWAWSNTLSIAPAVLHHAQARRRRSATRRSPRRWWRRRRNRCPPMAATVAATAAGGKKGKKKR